MQKHKMRRPDYIIVGPDPRKPNIANPGGQLTATAGLQKYADEQNLRIAFIDTLQNNFPTPHLLIRIYKALRRQVQFLWYAVAQRPRRGAIIFAAGPISFVERGITGLIARFFRINSVTCLRAGRLAPYLGAKSTSGKIISALARLQSQILVQGQNWLVDLERAGVERSRIHIVANWISPEKLIAKAPRAASPGQPIRFVFVGWLVVDKGLRELIQACQSIVKTEEQLHLTIVGGGTLYEELSEEVEKLALSSFITLTGWAEPPDVAKYLQNADVFVLPTYSEGFPNSLIEAFAAGLPAIASSVGAIPDSLKDQQNGFLIEPGNAESLAHAMTQYIRKPGLVEQHSKEAIRTVREKHDFFLNCASMLEVATTRPME